MTMILDELHDLDRPKADAPVPRIFGGDMHIQAGAEQVRFNAALSVGVTYTVERHGDILRVTGRKPGPFRTSYAFTIELPVDQLRRALGE